MNARSLICWSLFCSLLLVGLVPLGLRSGAVWAKQGKPAAGTSADEGAKKPMTAGEQQEYYELLRLFVDTLDQVERNYAKHVDRRELMEAAISGLISKLDDYSQYIPPEELDDFEKNITSRFGGIGIQIGLDRAGRLMVISPLVGTPAYSAGVLAGDRIVEIDGKSTKGLSLTDAVRRLKGPAGTEVSLTVLHRGRPEPQTVQLRREVVRIATVLGDHRNEDDSWQFLRDPRLKIGYIRVTAFSGQTASELGKALRQLQQQGFRGLILDLRFNPGGLLTSAVAVSDLFIKEGLIVSTDGRNVRKRSWYAKKKGTFDGFPMCVLVNRYSASASEIVAACLQDHGRAVIIGTRTFGKGSVQQVVDMEEGRSALKLTTGSYHRPSGKNIHRFKGAGDKDDWGVRPNPGMEIKLSDAQLRQLFRQWRQRDIVRPHEPAEEDAKEDAAKQDEPAAKQEQDEAANEPDAEPESPDEFIDPQMQKALDYLQSQLAPNGGNVDPSRAAPGKKSP